MKNYVKVMVVGAACGMMVISGCSAAGDVFARRMGELAVNQAVVSSVRNGIEGPRGTTVNVQPTVNNVQPNYVQPVSRQRHYDGKMEGGAHYKGMLFDNSPHGYGTLTYLGGIKYAGEFVNGIKNGQGTFTWPSGMNYTGKFKDDVRDGQGTLVFSDGSKYIGQFKDDKFEGHGILTYADGRKFVGQFKDNQSNGQGILTWLSGRKYVGGFKNWVANGHGTLTLANGVVYVGQFKGDKYNGQGTLTFPNGVKCVGQFKDNTFIGGHGTFSSPNGVFVGEMKNGLAYKGTFTGKDKIVISGIFIGDGKAGVITYPDGRKYEGEWNGDPEAMGETEKAKLGYWIYERPHGLGKMMYIDGKVEEGIWRKGKFLGKLSK